MSDFDLLTQKSRAARVQRVRASCGVDAWLVEDYAVPLVAFEFSLRGGAAQDPQGKAGLATFMAGLIDEGAGPMDSEAFREALEDRAIQLSFSTDRDYLSGHLQTLKKNIDPAFDLLKLALCAPRFDDISITRVRAQISAGLRRELKDPDSLAARAFRAKAFPDHPYGLPVQGDLESLEALTREDLTEQRSRLFARDNLVVAAVGAISAAELAAQIDKVFADLPAQSRLTPVRDITLAGLGDRLIEPLDVPQSTIYFARPSLARRDADFIPSVVANHILGGGAFTARLFREVREKRGLAYSVHSYLQNYLHSAIFIGSTSTKNERAGEALAVIEEQIRDLSDNGPTADELEKAQRYLIGSYDLRLDTSTKIASQLTHLQIEGYDVSYLDDRNKQIAAVTQDSIRRAAKRLLGDGVLLVSIAGKPEGLEAKPAS